MSAAPLVTVRLSLTGLQNGPVYLGQSIELTAEFFTAQGTPAAQVTNPRFVMRREGVYQPWQLAGADLTKTGPGKWRSLFTPNEPGVWFIRADCSELSRAADETRVVVRPSVTLPEGVTGVPLLMPGGVPASTADPQSALITSLPLIPEGVGFVVPAVRTDNDEGGRINPENLGSAAVEARSPLAVAGRLRASTTRPFVVLVQGQSNAVGAGSGGDLNIDQRGAGVFIYSNLAGGGSGSMVPAVFGTPPLNVPQNDGTRNCLAPHIGTRLRQLQLVPDTRPIWILVNAIGGISIGEWVGDGVNSPRFVGLVSALNRMQQIWQSQGGTGTLTIDHMHWQQGEADSTTAGPYNTRATYLEAWDTFMAQHRALPQWSPETTVTVAEIGRWARFTASDTGVQIGPANARNEQIWEIGSGRRDPKVSLIQTLDLPPNGTLAEDANHYSGAGLVEIGKRVADTLVGLRVGSLGRPPLTTEGWADSRIRRIDISNATRTLSDAEISGGFHLSCANADIRLPMLPTSGIGVIGFVEVWSASGGPTLLRPPNDLLQIDTALGLQPAGTPASLPLGKYFVFVSRGRWCVRGLDLQRGLATDLSSLAVSAPRVVTADEARSCAMGAFSNKISLPTANAGNMVLITCRSITNGPTVIGRSIVSALISSGGTGYSVGDVLTLPLGAATGDPATVTVTTVGPNGVITGIAINYAGHITSTTAPTSPATPTGGTGTGASITQTIGTGAFVRGAATSGSLTLNTAEQTILLAANGAAWRVLLDTALDGKGLNDGGSLVAGDTLTTAQATGNLLFTLPAGSYTIPSANLMGGNLLGLLASGGDVTITTSAGLIYLPSGRTATSFTMRDGQSVILARQGNARWGIVGGSLLSLPKPLQIFVPTTGTTVSIGDSSTAVINPASALASLSIQLPPTPQDRDEVWIYFQQGVTSISWTRGVPVPARNSAAAGDRWRLIYSSSLGAWI